MPLSMMVPSSHPFAKIFDKDKRFAPAAYFFVFDALGYAQEHLGYGRTAEAEEEEERHVTGQELCQAIREYAQEQFGYMAKCVLNSWGVTKTEDFGDIVYNLIEIGKMRKTPEDRREDFIDVFDFEKDLKQKYEIVVRE